MISPFPMRRTVLWVVTSVLLCRPALSQDAAATPPVGKIGSIKATSKAGVTLGSCFLVSEKGYVATSFSVVQHAISAVAQFPSGKFDVAGVVAASKGKDIAILALNGPLPAIVPIDMRTDATLVEDEPLFPWAGPMSKPFTFRTVATELSDPAPQQQVFYAKYVRHLRGDEVLLGLPDVPQDLCGGDAETTWLWIDQARERSCAGGPLFDELGKVVGMMSLAPAPEDAIQAAVHVRHVVELLPTEEAKPQALSGLSNWKDSFRVPTAAESAEEPHKDGLSGISQRGWSLAKRFEDYQARLSRAERETASIDKSLIAAKSQRLEILTAIDALKDRSQSGERYARRVELQKLDLKVAYQNQRLLPHLKTTCKKLKEQWFNLTDPLALRPTSEHTELVEALTAAIEEGGAPGSSYLMRAMSRANVGQYDLAKADLAEVGSIDASLKPLAKAIEGRVLILAGKREEGQKLYKVAAHAGKQDARLQIIGARLELDRENNAAAIRMLSKPVAWGADRKEVDLALAWLCSTARDITPAQSKLAVPHARDACRATGCQDWFSLAALAASYERANDYASAAPAMEAAAKLAPESAAEQCQKWRAELSEKRTFSRP